MTHQRGHQQNADTTQHRKLCRIIYCPVGALNDDAVSRNGAWREWVVHANEPILSHVPKYKRVDHARARNPESWWRFANCDSVFSINAPRAPLSSIPISIPLLCVRACQLELACPIDHLSCNLAKSVLPESWRNISKLNGR